MACTGMVSGITMLVTMPQLLPCWQIKPRVDASEHTHFSEAPMHTDHLSLAYLETVF